MVNDLSHSPCWCSPLLNHKLRIRSTRHLHRLSINNQRLRTPQTQRPTHPHPAIRRRNRSVPPHRKTNRIRIRCTTPNRHTRHRETLLLRQPRNRRLPPRRSLAHHKTRQLHTLAIMHLPMRRKLLNLSSKVLRRQLQHPTRRGLGPTPALAPTRGGRLRAPIRACGGSGGAVLGWCAGVRLGLVFGICSTHANRGCGQLRGGHAEGKDQDEGGQDSHAGARQPTTRRRGRMGVLPMGVLTFAHLQTRRQRQRARQQPDA